MIEIKNLHFGYNRNDAIFSNINLTLLPGKIYGLLGENGVGKTTLLRLICGLLFPTSGSCRSFSYESRYRLPSILSQIYYLPESIDVPSITIQQYTNNYSKLYPNFDNAKLEEYLGVLNIEDVSKRLRTYSHGQQKKIMLAFALACKTPLLLLDEPTNGLDIPSKSVFRQIIASASNADTTFVISTHQVRDLEGLIDPIIILEQNQVLLNNSVSEITSKLKFSMDPAPAAVALHSEPVPGGFVSVTQNDDNSQSNVNIEVLFNTAIKHKELFKNIFINQ